MHNSKKSCTFAASNQNGHTKIFTFMKKFLFILAVLGLVACNENKPAANEQQQPQEEHFVDANLPSGSQWAAQVETTAEKPDGLFTAEEAQTLFSGRIPTKDQWEELLANCSITKKGNFLELTVNKTKEEKAPARRGIEDLPEELLNILIPLAGNIDCEAEDIEDQLMAYLWAATSDDPMKKLEWYVAIQESGFSFANAAEACAELSVLLVEDNTVPVPEPEPEDILHPKLNELMGTWYSYMHDQTELPDFDFDSYMPTYILVKEDGDMRLIMHGGYSVKGNYTYNERNGQFDMHLSDTICYGRRDITLYWTLNQPIEHPYSIPVLTIDDYLTATLYMQEKPVYIAFVNYEEKKLRPFQDELSGTWRFVGDIPERLQDIADKLLYFGPKGYYMAIGSQYSILEEGTYSYNEISHYFRPVLSSNHGMTEVGFLVYDGVENQIRYAMDTFEETGEWQHAILEKVSDENLIATTSLHPTAEGLKGTWQTEITPAGLETYTGYLYYFGDNHVLKCGTMQAQDDYGNYGYDEETGECSLNFYIAPSHYNAYIFTLIEDDPEKMTMTQTASGRVWTLKKISTDNLIGSQDQ